jgi:hypothetical protein
MVLLFESIMSTFLLFFFIFIPLFFFQLHPFMIEFNELYFEFAVESHNSKKSVKQVKNYGQFEILTKSSF